MYIGHCKLFSSELEHVLEADPTEGPVSWLVCGKTGRAAVGDVATPEGGVAVVTGVTCVTFVIFVTFVTVVTFYMCYLVQVEHLEDTTPQQGQGLSLSCVA